MRLGILQHLRVATAPTTHRIFTRDDPNMQKYSVQSTAECRSRVWALECLSAWGLSGAFLDFSASPALGCRPLHSGCLKAHHIACLSRSELPCIRALFYPGHPADFRQHVRPPPLLLPPGGAFAGLRESADGPLWLRSG